MSGTKSIQPTLLNDTASFLADEVASVLVNDSIEITDFSLKQSSDNVTSIQYTIRPSMTNLVTDIKLRRADGTVLTQVSVYVPVSQDILSKHIITVKEGV